MARCGSASPFGLGIIARCDGHSIGAIPRLPVENFSSDFSLDRINAPHGVEVFLRDHLVFGRENQRRAQRGIVFANVRDVCVYAATRYIVCTVVRFIERKAYAERLSGVVAARAVEFLAERHVAHIEFEIVRIEKPELRLMRNAPDGDAHGAAGSEVFFAGSVENQTVFVGNADIPPAVAPQIQNQRNVIPSRSIPDIIARGFVVLAPVGSRGRRFGLLPFHAVLGLYRDVARVAALRQRIAVVRGARRDFPPDADRVQIIAHSVTSASTAKFFLFSFGFTSASTSISGQIVYRQIP